MPRSARIFITAFAALAALLAAPGVAHAIDPCDLAGPPGIPSPTKAACEAGKKIVEKGPDVVANPGEAAKDIVTAPVKAAGDEVMKGITTWVGNGAAWLVGQAGKLIDETTTPRIESPWFMRQYGTMGALAAIFALPLLLLSVLQGVLRHDGGVIVRAAFVQLPLAFVLTAMAVTVVQLFLQLTDAMSAQVAASVGNDAKEFFKDTGKSLGSVMAATGGTNPLPLFAVFLGALVAAAGAFFVWIELLIRSAAIYVAVLFLPFTFVAMIWPATARWCRRLIEVLIAIILSKFVIVAIMALAAAGLGQSRADDAFQGVLAGAALMLLAAFSPFALLKLIPLAEAAVHSAGARSGAGSSTLAPIASPSMVMRRVMDANWGGGGGLRTAPAFAGGAAAAGAAATGSAGAVRRRAEGIGNHAVSSNGSRPHDDDPTARMRAGGARPPAASDGAAGPQGARPAERDAAPHDRGGAGPRPTDRRPGGTRPADPSPPPKRPDSNGPGGRNHG